MCSRITQKNRLKSQTCVRILKILATTRSNAQIIQNKTAKNVELPENLGNNHCEALKYFDQIQ